MIQYKEIELYTNRLLIFTFGNFMIMIKLCIIASLCDAYKGCKMPLNLSQFLRILIKFAQWIVAHIYKRIINLQRLFYSPYNWIYLEQKWQGYIIYAFNITLLNLLTVYYFSFLNMFIVNVRKLRQLININRTDIKQI